jgi:hypothetical protein
VDECRERWRRGVPLLAETTPGIPSNDLDDLLSPALEFLTAAGHDVGALRRFAEAWDDGAVEPAVFLPERGRLGSPAQHDVEGDEELACEGDLRLGAMHDAEVATPQIVVRTSGERSGLAQHPTEQGVALLRDLAEALFVGRRVDRRRQADNDYAGDAVLVESAIAGGTR